MFKNIILIRHVGILYYSMISFIFSQNLVEVYIMRRYCTIVTSGGGEVKRTFKRDTCSLVNFVLDFTRFVEKQIQSGLLKDMIFVDQVK